MLSFIEEAPFNGKPPKKLMIFLHGYGSNKEDLFSLKDSFLDILQDTQFISVDGPDVCEFGGEGRQWFSLKSMDIFQIMHEINEHYRILNEFIKIQINRFNLSSKDVILVGFSQGSMMALYGSLRYPEKFLAVISFSGVLADMPMHLEKEIRSKQTILLIHGSEDKVVPYEYMYKTEQILRSFDIDFTSYTCFGLEHQINIDGIAKAREFIQNLI